MSEAKKVHWRRWSEADAKGVQRWFTPCGYRGDRGNWLRVTPTRRLVTCKRCKHATREATHG